MLWLIIQGFFLFTLHTVSGGPDPVLTLGPRLMEHLPFETAGLCGKWRGLQKVSHQLLSSLAQQ